MWFDCYSAYMVADMCTVILKLKLKLLKLKVLSYRNSPINFILKLKVESGCCECGRLCSKHVFILVWLIPRVMDGSAGGYKIAHLCPPRPIPLPLAMCSVKSPCLNECRSIRGSLAVGNHSVKDAAVAILYCRHDERG